MTSTYLPLFLPFFAPPLLPEVGGAALRRSSMLLALLMLVPGRLGGAIAPPPEADLAIGGAPPDADRAIEGAPPKLSEDAILPRVPGIDMGGGTLILPPMGGGVLIGGGGVPLTERDPNPFGGGGAADLASVFSAPGFLLIHRLSSGS